MNQIQNKLLESLKKYFGFNQFKPGQEETLISLLSGYSTLAILPTGTGKSLCYQLFGKMTQSKVLVISPLISLMQDQVEQIKYQKLGGAIALTSNLTGNERKYVLNHFDQFQFIFASPEILQNQYLFNVIKNAHIRLMVVDEAHCIAQWGPDFRPDYLTLGKIRSQLDFPLTLALTATATPAVEREIQQQLRFENNSNTIRYSVNRPNIFLATEILDNQEEKNRRLLELVQQLKMPGLIYFSSKKVANEITDLLNRKTNLRAAAYHADLSIEDRFSIQHQFIENKLDVVCATSAFGMGINKKDIRFVLHYHLPADLESYVQEIGRAGRDGAQSIAILLYCPGDEMIQQQIQLNTLPDKNEIQYYAQHPKMMSLTNDDSIEILNSFFKMGVSAEKLVHFFAQRKVHKNQALLKVLAYINTKECKRNFILNYFEEPDFIEHNRNCCSNNGEYDLKNLSLEREKYIKEHVKLKEYPNILQTLFNLQE